MANIPAKYGDCLCGKPGNARKLTRRPGNVREKVWGKLLLGKTVSFSLPVWGHADVLVASCVRVFILFIMTSISVRTWIGVLQKVREMS